MNSKEFLQSLEKNNQVWESYEYSEEKLIKFAEYYHFFKFNELMIEMIKISWMEFDELRAKQPAPNFPSGGIETD